MMHDNGDYYFWGLHMFWWFFVPILIILVFVLMNRFRNK